MANQFQQYTVASVYLNSALLAEEVSVTVKRATNAQNIKTVHKGFAGQSPGAAMTEITVENVVPAASFEFDPSRSMEELKIVEFTIFAGGKTLTFQGYITEDNFSHSVDNPSGLSFSAVGNFAKWD